jgi:hypothetical protein
LSPLFSQSHSPAAKIEKKSRIFGKKLSDDTGGQSPTSPFKDDFHPEIKSSVLEHGLKLLKKTEQAVSKAESLKTPAAPLRDEDVRTPSPHGFPTKRPFSSFLGKLPVADPEAPKTSENRSHTPNGMGGAKSPEEFPRFASFVGSEDSNSFICTQNPSNLRGRAVGTSFNSSKKSISPVLDNAADTSIDFSSLSDNANDSTDFRKGLQHDSKSANQSAASFKPTNQVPASETNNARAANEGVASFGLSREQNEGTETRLKTAESAVLPESGTKSSTAKTSTPQKPNVESTATPKRRRKRLRSSCEVQDEDTSTQEISVSWRPDSVSIRHLFILGILLCLFYLRILHYCGQSLVSSPVLTMRFVGGKSHFLSGIC